MERRFERVMLPVSEIVFDEFNPNKMSFEEEKGLERSLEKFGYVQEVVVDKRTRKIADGEHRAKKLIDKGVTELEVKLFDFKDDAERRLFRQTMNKLRGEHDKVLDLDEFKYLALNGGLEELQDLIGKQDINLVQFLASSNSEEKKPLEPKNVIIEQPGLKIINKEALQALKEMPSDSVDCVMTSPPYWALRDYGVKGQIGLEPTFEEFINDLCDIFDEVKRVLKPTGTCWVNLGDTYSGSMQGFGAEEASETGFQSPAGIDERYSLEKPLCAKTSLPAKSKLNIPARFSIEMQNRGWILRNDIIWHKPNCMPSSVEDRFTVDYENIYFFVKSPKYYFETQRDEVFYPSEKTEKLCMEIYLKAKQERDGSVYEGSKNKDNPNTQSRGVAEFGVAVRGVAKEILKKAELQDFERKFMKDWVQNRAGNVDGRNVRCVWKISTHSYEDAHFATYPEKLCLIPIKAGCPKEVCTKCGKIRQPIYKPTPEYVALLGKSWVSHNSDKEQGFGQQMREGYNKLQDLTGIERYTLVGYDECNCGAPYTGGAVLDPFAGSGTTLKVALDLGRNAIGIEINPEYVELIKKRFAENKEKVTE